MEFLFSFRDTDAIVTHSVNKYSMKASSVCSQEEKVFFFLIQHKSSGAITLAPESLFFKEFPVLYPAVQLTV